MLNVLYLVHDIADPAVARRIAMLRDGGADVALAGFRRGQDNLPEDIVVTELGTTFDAKFLQRLMAIGRATGGLAARFRNRPAPDIIIARNLEMLFLAQRLRGVWQGKPAIAYECLDIHRLLLREDVIGRLLRGVERRLVQDARVLLTSSPAFLHQYFEAYEQARLPSLLIENKVHGPSAGRGTNPALHGSNSMETLRIGWFGALRCNRSLQALAAFSRAMDGRVEIVLRGRPALSAFDDFHGFVAGEPYLSFEGAYRNPEDLAAIYSDVHLAWAIDYFEAGQNSAWLLPNRIYEGSLHGAVPVALRGTATADMLIANGIGVVVPDIEVETLIGRLGVLSPEKIARLAGDVAAKPASLFAHSQSDCRDLVARLAEYAMAPPAERKLAA